MFSPCCKESRAEIRNQTRLAALSDAFLGLLQFPDKVSKARGGGLRVKKPSKNLSPLLKMLSSRVAKPLSSRFHGGLFEEQNKFGWWSGVSTSGLPRNMEKQVHLRRVWTSCFLYSGDFLPALCTNCAGAGFRRG